MSTSSNFRPLRSKALFAGSCGAFLVFMAVLLSWIMTDADRAAYTFDRIVAMVLLTVINPMGLAGLWMLSIGVGVLRAFVRIEDEKIELRAHRFAIWGIRRMRRARLRWNEIAGVQLFEIPNMFGSDGVQRDYILHTSVGRFALPNILWPEAERIASLVADRIGRPIGDLSATSEPVTGERTVDQIGVRLMRGLGWLSTVCGIVFAICLVIVCLREPNRWTDLGPAFGATAILITAGEFLRRFRFK